MDTVEPLPIRAEDQQRPVGFAVPFTLIPLLQNRPEGVSRLGGLSRVLQGRQQLLAGVGTDILLHPEPEKQHLVAVDGILIGVLVPAGIFGSAQALQYLSIRQARRQGANLDRRERRSRIEQPIAQDRLVQLRRIVRHIPIGHPQFRRLAFQELHGFRVVKTLGLDIPVYPFGFPPAERGGR